MSEKENIVEFIALKREGIGRSAAKKVRNDSQVPATIYGNKQAPLSISISFNELMKYLDRGGLKQSKIILNVDGTSHTVKLQDLQLHPIRHLPIHADFLRIA